MTKSGKKTWQIGFRDHENRIRSRSFGARAQAEKWIQQYKEAERFDRLGEFLAKPVATALVVDPSLGDVIRRWLLEDAHPEGKSGLAPNTYRSYASALQRHVLGYPTRRKKDGEHVISRPAVLPLSLRDNDTDEAHDGDGHGPEVTALRYAIGHLPLSRFRNSEVVLLWYRAMGDCGVAPAGRERAWAALSSAFTWAAQKPDIPLDVNPCRGVNRHYLNKRRSSRRVGTASTPGETKSKRTPEAWALDPISVELVRLVLGERYDAAGVAGGRKGATRPFLLARLDQMIVSLGSGLGCRPQEGFGLLWRHLSGDEAHILQVVSSGQLDYGKTRGATGIHRLPPIDSLLCQDLDEWKADRLAAGLRVGPDTFVLPGNLAGHGAPTGHFTASQARNWGRRHFQDAVNETRIRWPAHCKNIVGATPYSLRRGLISLRIRAGDGPQEIANDCGTSIEILSRHYSTAFTSLRKQGPLSWQEERLKARTEALEIYQAWLR